MRYCRSGCDHIKLSPKPWDSQKCRLKERCVGNAIHAGEPTSPGETPASDQSTPLPAANQPEEITKAFEALRSKLKPQLEEKPVPTAEDANEGASGAFVVSPSGMDFEPAANVKRAPGEFTMEFFSGFDQRESGPGTIQPPPATAPRLKSWDCPLVSSLPTALTARCSSRRQDSVTEIDGGKSAKSDNRLDTAELANLLRSSSTQPETKLPHTTSPEIASAKPAAIGAGEFTNFFQGPFDGEKPSNTPELSLPVPKPEQTGDFTRIFGPMKEGSSPECGRNADV